MLRELITWILNTYLGKYLENFNPAQLSVALLSGEMELENVPIRKDAFRNLDLPLIAYSGIIQKIKLQIPIRQFRTAPWCITIEKLYVVIGPKDLNDWDDEKERQIDLEYKLSQLEDSAIKWNMQKEDSSENSYYSSSYSSWLNIGSNLATNVIENLELKIIDVHIRYEDNVTIPNCKFASGIKIESLTAQKRNSSWLGIPESPTQETLFKLIELKNFFVYWDQLKAEDVCSNTFSAELVETMEKKLFLKKHSCIMLPVSAKAECTHDKSPNPLRTRLRPRLSCNVTITELILNLSNFQYTQLIGCMRGLRSIYHLRLYRLKRPACPIKGNALAWWKYACECYGFKHESEKIKWNKAINNIKYIKIYRTLLTNPNQNLLPSEKQLKFEVEKSRSLSELKVLRQVSILHLHIDINLKTQNGNSASGMLYQWFPYWWGWYRNSSHSKDSGNSETSHDQNPDILEDEILSVLSESVENTSLLNKDAVFGKFNFVLLNSQVIICSENLTTGEMTIGMEINFTNINLYVETRPRSGSHVISLSLGSVCLKDRITEKTQFPDLIKPQFEKKKINEKNHNAEKTENSFNLTQNYKEGSNSHEIWFQLQYEKKPIRFNTDFRLVIKTRSLDIVYNMCAYKWLSEFLKTPLQNTNAIEGVERMANTRTRFFKNWKRILHGDLNHRRTWSLEIDVSAPQIIFVEDFQNKRTNIVLVDFGRFELLKNANEHQKPQMTGMVNYERAVSLNNSIEEEIDSDAFMTPFSTPPGSMNSTLESPTSELPIQDWLSSEDRQHTKLENAFHNKIYDKYSIDLTDLQVLVCKNGDIIPSASFKSSSTLHLLDRFNISLKLDRRVVNTSDPEYPSLIICGSLPKIVAHINERKIIILMNVMNRFFAPSIRMLEPSTSHTCSESLTHDDCSQSENTLFSDDSQQSSLLFLQFVIDEVSLEVQSCNRSIVELQITGAKLRLERRQREINILMSVHGLLLVDAIQSFGPDFELLVASHRNVGMDSVSGSLRQSEPDELKKSALPKFINQDPPFLRSSSHSFHSECSDALIILEVNLTDPAEGADAVHTADINFNNLDIIANQETILELLSFINRSIPKKSHTLNYTTVTQDKQQQTPYNICGTNIPRLMNVQRNFSFHFHRLNILIMSSIVKEAVYGKKVATFTMCEAKIHASLYLGVSVYGSLGGLQILDLTQGTNHPRILSVGKDPLTDSVKTAGQDLLKLSENLIGTHGIKDSIDEGGQALCFNVLRDVGGTISLKMRMASVCYTHSVRFLHEISMCANEFRHYLKNFAFSLRKKAANMAIGFVQNSHESETPEVFLKSFKSKSRSHLKIEVDFIFDTPVLVLPKSELSSEVLVAHLGKITVTNNESEMSKKEGNAFSGKIQSDKLDEKYCNCEIYFIDIRNINLFSLDTNNRKNSRTTNLQRAVEFYSCETDATAILHDTVIQLSISKYVRDIISMESNNIKTEQILCINGIVIQPLQMSLCKRQYEQLLETFYNIFTVPVEASKGNLQNERMIDKEKEFRLMQLENQEIFNGLEEATTNISHDGLIKKISFSLPTFVIQLKNELDHPLIEITFLDFSVRYDHLDNYEILFQVMLRSILMEDLKCPVDSKYRQMVISSSKREHKKRSQRHQLSSSCPSLVRLQRKHEKIGSLPENLGKYTGFQECLTPFFCRSPQNFCYLDLDQTSCYPGTPPSSPLSKGQEDNLVIYSALLIDTDSPRLNTQRQNRRQNSSIEFNSLNLIVSVERWFVILDFLGLLSDNSNKNTEIGVGKEVLESTSGGNSDLEITVRSLNLVLVRKNSELAKANVSNAFFIITKLDGIKAVEGRLGSISLLDLTDFGRLYQEKFSTSGPEALSFAYKRNTLKKLYEPLESEATLRIHMSSARYVYTKRFLIEIQAFVKELTQLQAPVIKRIKFTERSFNLVESLKLGLEISAGSPIVQFPICFNSNEVIVADLGEFSLKNSFRFASVKQDIIENQINPPDEILDVMQIDFGNTNFFTAIRIPKTKKVQFAKHEQFFLDMGSYWIFKTGEHILSDNCHLKLQVERNLNCSNNHKVPDISVQGTFSKLGIILSLEQNKLIHDFLVQNMGEVVTDINVEHSLPDNKVNFESTNQDLQNKTMKTVWNTLSINLNLEDVSVMLNLPCKLDNEKKDQSLACINLMRSSLKINVYNDGSENIDLVSREILISEKKYNAYSADKENCKDYLSILEPIREFMDTESVQVAIHSRKKHDMCKYTVLLSNMRIIALLEWIAIMQEYFNSYDKSLTKNRDLKLSSKASENFPIQVVLNITDSELVFVQKDDQLDTNAFIFKTTATLSYEPSEMSRPVVIDVSHMEVFSCIIGLESETALSIIDPITLKIGFEDNTVNVQIEKELCIRLSYHDVKRFIKIIESAQNYSGSKNNFFHSVFSLKQDLGTRNENEKEHKWIKTVNVSAIALNSQCIKFILIDDCKNADVPLIELVLSKINFKNILDDGSFNLKNAELTNKKLSCFSGFLEAMVAAEYYNRRFSGWEPVIEQWKCTARWNFSQNRVDDLDKFFLNLKLSSKDLLRINLTTPLFELWKLVHNNWIQDYYEIKKDSIESSTSNIRTSYTIHRKRTPFIPFSLLNDTKEYLNFKILLVKPGGITQTELAQHDMISNWINVPPDKMIPFSFCSQNKLRHNDSHKLNLHQILVHVEGWSVIGPLSIDKEGVFFRYASKNLHENVKTRIVFQVSLMGYAQKLITIRSALSVINCLDQSILVNLNQSSEKKLYSTSISPGKFLNVPLNLVESSIFFKPLYDDEEIKSNKNNDQKEKNIEKNDKYDCSITTPKGSNKCVQYKFCSSGISWWTCVGDEVQEERTCQAYNENTYNTIVVIKRDNFPNRSNINMPGHTITIVPPLKIINLLCCDLIFKISESMEGRINAGERSNVYEMSLNKNINLSITVDNYKAYGHLTIPAGHIGIVETKLKLLDNNNRSLHLRVSIQSVKGSGMEVTISCPFWLVNKTGLPLIFRQESLLHPSSGQFSEHEEAKVIAPLLFSFSDIEAPPLLEMRLGNRYGKNNHWCQSFSLCKDVVYRTLKTADYSETFTIGITIQRGRGCYSKTSIVTLSSRFQLYNRSSHELQFTQKCCTHEETGDCRSTIYNAISGCHFPFHWPRFDQEPLLCVRLQDVYNCHWSSGIPINEAQSLYINIRNDFGDMFFLRLEIILQGATYFLLFSDAYSLPPPIRFENFSDVPIKFFQCNHIPEWHTNIKPKFSLAYALDDPLGSRNIRVFAPGGNYVNFPIQNHNFSHILTYSNFIYIAVKGTFETLHSENKYDVQSQNLVLGVKDRKVILMRKCAGDRSQLWLMNSCGQIEHEGSSPPMDSGHLKSKQLTRLVLDLEKAPNPMTLTNMVVRAANKQRNASQTWRFENERLLCHSNMCAQVRDRLFGLRVGSEVVLGRITVEEKNCDFVPIEEKFEIQKLRPGSGHLELSSGIDGPIKVIKIRDLKSETGITLTSDPLWKNASATIRQSIKEEDFQNNLSRIIDKSYIKITLHEGVGISVVSGRPYEEIAYITLQDINFEFLATDTFLSFEFLIKDLQIDNQLLDSPCPVFLYTPKLDVNDKAGANAFSLSAKVIPSRNKNIVIIEYMICDLRSCVLYLEERFLLKVAMIFGLGKEQNIASNLFNDLEYDMQHVENHIMPVNAKRYYFENLHIGSSQIRLSVITASKLSPEGILMKKKLGLTLIKFEDVLIEFEQFAKKHCFETMEVYIRLVKLHYKKQFKWNAASILGSVDFLGNPLGFANDLSEGVSGLIFEGSLKTLVKNVTHGISNSTAKLTGTISDGLGRVVLDEQDKEARQKILDIPTHSYNSGEQLAAGIKGFGFGLLGGITSLVRYTYSGAQADGLQGFISGLGRGIIGTVTKPIIGVLDLASKTANAVRETSRSEHRILPSRKRLPRCVTGAPGSLLPQYSNCQSKGQQYLYIINKRNFSEHLIHYEPNLCNDQDAKLRLLVSSEYLRIFSRNEEEPVILLECHLSEVLSCHPITANCSKQSLKNKNVHYIEISTNLPKITRPRVRCRSEEMAEKSARSINYAKRVYDERELTLNCDLSEYII